MSLQIKAILYLTVLMAPYDLCLTMENEGSLGDNNSGLLVVKETF